MALYMLNLLFDFGSRDGIFSDLQTAGVPLLSSKHWLRLDPIPNPLNVETANWVDLGAAGTLLVARPPQNPEHRLAVRIAPIPAAPIDAAASAELAVAMGRPVIAVVRQNFASPFVVGNPPQTLTAFRPPTFGPRPAPPPNGLPTGWFFELGQIGRRPPSRELTHRFEFALGINVTSQGVMRSYGEDPEFDIEG